MSGSRASLSIRGIGRKLWQRHRWSLPLSVASTIFFVRLGFEMREGELDAFDSSMQHVVDGFRGPWDQVMLFLTSAGEIGPMTLLTVVVLIALVLRKRPREARFLAVSSLGSLLLNILLKALFHRARPAAALGYLISVPTSLSFPSGHTMGATGVVGSLIIVVRALGAPRPIFALAAVLGSAFVAGVALSRVYLGAHFPSDVLGGFLAESAWLSAITGWAYPRLLPGEQTP